MDVEEFIKANKNHPGMWHRELAKWAEDKPRCKCGNIVTTAKAFAEPSGKITVVFECYHCKRKAWKMVKVPIPKPEEFVESIY